MTGFCTMTDHISHDLHRFTKSAIETPEALFNFQWLFRNEVSVHSFTQSYLDLTYSLFIEKNEACIISKFSRD